MQEASVSAAQPFDPASHRNGAPLAGSVSAGERIALLVREHFAFVWRVLRRLGLSETDADDAAQQVFLVASRRIADIALGAERAFLFGTSMNVASRARRTERRRHEEPYADLDDERRDSTPGPEELIDRRRARELLDEILAEMSLELRVVFVLYEVEQLTMIEIAELLEVPQGTVASRLRRARQDFAERVARVEARRTFKCRGGRP